MTDSAGPMTAVEADRFYRSAYEDRTNSGATMEEVRLECWSEVIAEITRRALAPHPSRPSEGELARLIKAAVEYERHMANSKWGFGDQCAANKLGHFALAYARSINALPEAPTDE